jgi:hypothetical protein
VTARTDVYFNLHTGLRSMLDRRTGKVYEHARVIVSALPVDLVVQPAGQRKVVQEKSKNVHAFVRGSYLEPTDDVALWQHRAEALRMIPVSYNPYRGPSFYRKDTGQDLTEVKAIVMLAPHGAAPWVGALI